MSRHLDFLVFVQKSGKPVSAYVPGSGYADVTITTVDDDQVTLSIDGTSASLVMHYSQVILRQTTG